MSKRITIYLIRCLANGKVYIGQTSKTVQQRWNRHVSAAMEHRDDSPSLHNAIRKHGRESFTIKALCLVGSTDYANELEAAVISKYRTMDRSRGYNIKPGGNTIRGFRHSEQSREKMRNSSERFWSDPANRDVVAKRMSGKSNAAGKRTPEQCERLRQAAIIRYSKPEEHEKLRRAFNRPGVKDKKSKAIREALAKPEVKAKMVGHTHAAGHGSYGPSKLKGIKRPEISEKLKQLWQDPEYRTRVIVNQRAAFDARKRG